MRDRNWERLADWLSGGVSVMQVVTLLVVIWAVITLTGCDDDDTFIISPVLGKAVPEKCLGDPCLPGCESDDRVFECPPVVEEEECLYKGTRLESTLC